jgi:hypothetical protein
MPAGLYLLQIRGEQDRILNGDAKMSHFAYTYKRYEPFASEIVKQTFKYVPRTLPATDQTTIRCKIDRVGDLLRDSYFVFTLPDIWSPIPIGEDDEPHAYEFQWIPHIGWNIIDTVSVQVGGQTIAEHTGEWMKLQAHTNMPFEKLLQHQEMVGHTKDVYDPANAFGRMNQYPHAIRPSSEDDIAPSIRGRTIIVPFQFFFCEGTKQPLPLCLLEYAEVEFVITLRPLYELFTILEVRSGRTDTGTRIKPNPSISHHLIHNFLKQPAVNGLQTDTAAHWDLGAYIEANFIFLDDDERRSMACKPSRNMLVKELKYHDYDHLYGSVKLEVQAHNLVTQMKIVGQRTDSSTSNAWDNYTNWANHEVQPYVDMGLTTPLVTNYFSSGLLPDNLDPRIVLEMQLHVSEGKPIMDLKPEYLSSIHQLRNYLGKPLLPGIQQLSFALDQWDLQPSGAINASVAGKLHLKLSLNVPPVDPTTENPAAAHANGNDTSLVATCLSPTLGLDRNIAKYTRTPHTYFLYTYNVRVYVEAYNVLAIRSGTAGLKYAV